MNTNSPSWDWEGRGRIIAGNFGTRQVSAMLSGPVVKGELAFRASGDLRLGRVSNDMTDRIDGADIDRDDYGTARFKLRYQPQELPGAMLEATLAHTRSQAPQFEGVLKPFEKRRLPVPSPMIGVMKVDATSLTTRAEYDWTPGLHSKITVSHGDARLRRFGLPGLGQTRADTSDFSIEPTLHWRKGKEIGVFLGIHRFWMDQVQTIDITGLGIGFGDFNDTQNSLGLFGEANWRPVERLQLTGGLRYQRDRQIRTGKVGSIALDFDRTFDAWLPKVSLAYDLSRHVTAGIMAQRAYNPGGTSISLLRRAEDTFEAERLWNYEAFLRATSAGGRRRLTVNAFYNDIENAQRPQLVPIELPSGGTIYATEFANAPAARSFGLEADLSWQVRNNLNVRVGVGILETKVLSTADPGDPSLGKSFQRAPGFTAAGALDWQPLAGLDLSMQVRHQSGYFSDDTGRQDLRIDASTVVDARAAYSYGPLTAFAYARNLFDKHYLTYLFRPDFGAVGKPREAGIGLEARF